LFFFTTSFLKKKDFNNPEFYEIFFSVLSLPSLPTISPFSFPLHHHSSSGVVWCSRRTTTTRTRTTTTTRADKALEKRESSE